MFEQIPHFKGARDALGQQSRVDAVRVAAHRFHDHMRGLPKAAYFESFDLVKLPYTTAYGLRDAFSLSWLTPFLHIQNRMFIVQFQTSEGLKTMLVSPSDHERGEDTPYFRRLSDRVPDVFQKILVKRQATVISLLKQVGLAPEQIDYITYDHLHTQDIRRWLGTTTEEALLPNAKLIVHEREWASAQDLNPHQRDWYCPDGVKDVSEDKIIQFTGDIMLGEGVALIHTPGHTEGNHSIVVHTDEGLWVTSENGISVDTYEPKESRVPGLKKYAETLGVEVVINGNSLENSVDQYISMIQEKTIAGASQRDPRFPNIFPSSEMTPFALFFGTTPSMYVGKAEHGMLKC